LLAANVAFLSLQAAALSPSSKQSEKFLKFAQAQISVLVGKKGQGFIVGVGSNSPWHPHHRGRLVLEKCKKS